jgi:putative transposase
MHSCRQGRRTLKPRVEPEKGETLGKVNHKHTSLKATHNLPMPQSLVKILVHIVFSTKNRDDLILPEKEDALYGYISGIVTGNNARLIIANGTTDHSHFLVSLGRNDTSVLIGNMKRDSSFWAKTNGLPDLYWQRGYGAFSIGQSQVPEVTKYIANQKLHHKNQSYMEEFRALCRKYNVDLDERYCWD